MALTQAGNADIEDLVEHVSDSGIFFTYSEADGRIVRSTGVVIDKAGVLYGTLTQVTGYTGTVFALSIGSGLVPSINTGGVVNAASYTAPVAPGSIASAFGNLLLSSPVLATQSPLPDEISGLSLQFGGTAEAPLFFASSAQINFPSAMGIVRPIAIRAGRHAGYCRRRRPNGEYRASRAGYFHHQRVGLGPGSDPGYVLSLDGFHEPRGRGQLCLDLLHRSRAGRQSTRDGIARSQRSAGVVGHPTVTIGGVPANVQFSGLAPGYVGLYQVNAQVPAGLATGSNVPVVMSISGATSNTATLAVQ